ncbi:MAG: heme-binding domain-containing protein [Gemmatimonadota bacterium]|nr:MAG: heme-binding domain-containing protein [Gemmatimonadota bacterium]
MADVRKLLRPRWFAIGVILIFAALQLKTVDRSNPPVQSDIGTSPEIKEILRRACYDCHSNETRWPWYSYIAPMSWFVAGHVDHGRGHLNYSEWPTFDLDEQEHLFEEMWEVLSEGEMPLRSYTLIHWDARLTEDERSMLLEWVRPGSTESEGDGG